MAITIYSKTFEAATSFSIFHLIKLEKNILSLKKKGRGREFSIAAMKNNKFDDLSPSHSLHAAFISL